MTGLQSGTRLGPDVGAATWLMTLRRYMIFVAVANLGWEFAHMPLYHAVARIWQLRD